MPSRRLTENESKKANNLLDKVRARLVVLSAGDPELLFAYRRRIHIRLMQDERGRPVHRRKLKIEKWNEQNGVCALCKKKLPQKEAELDRFVAHMGYTKKNTRLVHHRCHRQDQAKRNYR